jgi:ribosome silencing factor RsfS/YbeB/iojap
MKTFAVVGLGSRGRGFANKIIKDENARLVAIADISSSSISYAKEKLGLSDEQCYTSAEEFFAKGKICDAIFLCTQDAQHYEMAIKALELGYDICLEKPAAVTIDECIGIRDTANRLGRKVMLTHVLRYAPFYQYIKKTIMSGVLGDIATINQTENIAYWHFALSYVRGPWRSIKDSSPTIIAKCCHDLDIIKWLMDKKCKSVSSFGSLFHYKPENAPKGSAEWCVDCDEQTKEKCLYNAYRIYPERMKYMLAPKEIAIAVTKALDEKKGMDIKLLKIDKVSSLADYFLICTGTSNTHVKTLCDYAEYALEQAGETMLGREGHRGNSWELLDYGTIVVHVFTQEAREFYGLERLWADAEQVDLSNILLPN